MSPRLGTMAGLPGYAYDERTQRYRNLDTGRMVARADVEELLRGVTEVAQERMARIGAAINDGLLSDAEGILALQNEMKRAGNANAALAAGGWDRMTQADWGHMGAWMRGQNEYLMGFFDDLQDPDKAWKEGEIERRAASYADTTFTQYYWKRKQMAGGDALGQWQTIGDERVCEICSGLEDLGVVPLSQLPLPGEPHLGCRCGLLTGVEAETWAAAWDTFLTRLAEGGPGSGNFGHVGVPGKHGGSAPGGGKLPSGKPKPRQGRKSKEAGPSLPAGVRQEEDRILDQVTETAVAWAADGRMIGTPNQGDGESVDITAEQRREVAGGIITHNHPDHIATLSPGDLQLAQEVKPRVLRAVTLAADGVARYAQLSLKPGQEWKGDIKRSLARDLYGEVRTAEIDKWMAMPEGSTEQKAFLVGIQQRIARQVAQRFAAEADMVYEEGEL